MSEADDRRDEKPPEAGSLWHFPIYTRLRGQAYPLFVSDDGITPGASLWTGMRLWTAAFRAAGLRSGDRIVLALPPSPGFLCCLLAGLWDGLTLALLRPGGDIKGAARFLDASAGIGVGDGAVTWQADPAGLPVATGLPVRRAQTPPTPEARLLLSTSGTTAAPRWVALSDANLFAILDSHTMALGLAGARVLSVLPWHHAFGLVIDLLPALLSGAEVFRDEVGGRDPQRLVERMNEHGITHLNAVPLTLERLVQTPGGLEAAQNLRGGVIGGAAVGAALADTLGRTRLRVGYGQTEASPGIALGEPGRWRAGYLGRPLGCVVQIGIGGGLRFAGPNACLGFWGEAGLERLDPSRWVETGDLVRTEGHDMYFVARADDVFKLNNGRAVQAGVVESALRVQSPQLRHALLYTPDGEGLELLVGYAPQTPTPALSRSQACQALGTLGSRLRGVRDLPVDRWVQTPKGDMDRRAMLESLQHGALTPWAA